MLYRLSNSLVNIIIDLWGGGVSNKLYAKLGHRNNNYLSKDNPKSRFSTKSQYFFEGDQSKAKLII